MLLPPISRGCWSTRSRATRTSCCWGRPRGRSTSWPPRYPPSRRRATSRRSARHSHQKYLDCSKNICCSDPAAAAAAAGGDDPRAGAQRPGGGRQEPAETRPRHHQHQPLDQVLHISRAISITSTYIYNIYICIRKDRCLFLFNDIILISSVSRRGAKDIKRTISSWVKHE